MEGIVEGLFLCDGTLYVVILLGSMIYYDYDFSLDSFVTRNKEASQRLYAGWVMDRIVFVWISTVCVHFATERT